MTLTPLEVQFLAGLAALYSYDWLLRPRYRTFTGMIIATTLLTLMGQGLIVLIYHIRGF